MTCLWQVKEEMTLQKSRWMRCPEGRPPSAQPGRAVCGNSKIISSWTKARRAGSQTSAQPGGLGDGSPRLRSDDVAKSMSQPSRAGLMFGSRPSGPWKLPFLFRFSRKKRRPYLSPAYMADMGVTACSLPAFTKQPLPRRLSLEKSRTSLPFPVQRRSEMLQGGV